MANTTIPDWVEELPDDLEEMVKIECMRNQNDFAKSKSFMDFIEVIRSNAQTFQPFGFWGGFDSYLSQRPYADRDAFYDAGFQNGRQLAEKVFANGNNKSLRKRVF